MQTTISFRPIVMIPFTSMLTIFATGWPSSVVCFWGSDWVKSAVIRCTGKIFCS